MSDSRVEITRVFDSSSELLWAAWTEPKLMVGWFGSDPAGKGIRAAADLRVGGRFEVEFVTSTGDVYVCLGEYLEIVPVRKLVFTWRWRGSEAWTERVSIEFMPEGQGTSMRFVHSDIDPATVHGYAEGWSSTFDKLAAALAN